ncbi:MAG: hypothetical protein EU542_01235 [Promethearchaeota archaeon]|nr:MAG: hypothetical protein EU542_01235 [Candidatus Lokiarchaeota archaeon]
MAIKIYFPFSSISYFVPYVIYGVYIIAFSVVLISASKEYKNENYNRNLLKIGAIINIISISVLFFIPIDFDISGSIPNDQRKILTILVIVIPSLVAYLPRIFSFGIVFLVYGHKNQDRSGNYILFTGIFWLMYTIWAAFSLYPPFYNNPQLIFLMDYIFNLYSELYILIVLQQLLAIGGFFSLLGSIFLLLHGFINKDQKLKIAGFIYIIGNLTVGLGFIPHYIELMMMG